MTLTFQTKAHGPKVGYLFPGQGAQAVGMGQKLYEQSPAAREVFQQVDDALGKSLTRIMFDGPEEELRQTVNAQPGIMAVSLALVKAMEERLGEDHALELGEMETLVGAVGTGVGVLDPGHEHAGPGEGLEELRDERDGPADAHVDRLGAVPGLGEGRAGGVVRRTGGIDLGRLAGVDDGVGERGAPRGVGLEVLDEAGDATGFPAAPLTIVLGDDRAPTEAERAVLESAPRVRLGDRSLLSSACITLAHSRLDSA